LLELLVHFRDGIGEDFIAWWFWKEIRSDYTLIRNRVFGLQCFLNDFQSLLAFGLTLRENAHGSRCLAPGSLSGSASAAAWVGCPARADSRACAAAPRNWPTRKTSRSTILRCWLYSRDEAVPLRCDCGERRRAVLFSAIKVASFSAMCHQLWSASCAPIPEHSSVCGRPVDTSDPSTSNNLS
jgi:hypothetical protein